MRTTLVGWGACLFLAIVALAGCGDSAKMSEVSGTVKYDSSLVSAGMITFFPADGKGPTSGGPIKEGRYSVKVPVGMQKVSISMPKFVRKKKLYDTPNSPEQDVTDEGLPAKYNEATELTFEVKSGSNTKDWDLQK